MKKRCTYSKTNGYDRYGGAGIRVCERWMSSFDNFLADMGVCPSNKHTVDRYPNRKGDYEPSNCRWATYSQQTENKDQTVMIEYNGEMIALFLLAERFGIDKKLLYRRISLGWDIDNALTTPKIIKTTKIKLPPKSQLRGAKNPNSKSIKGNNIQTGESMIFNGLKEAADYLMGHKSCVANVISGASKTYKNWIFKHI